MSRHLAHLLYIIGAIIIIVGVVILVQENWSSLGFSGRLLVTLGIGFVAYLGGFAASGPSRRVFSQAMFTIAAILAPLGVNVLLTESGTAFTAAVQAFTALGLLAVFGIAWNVTRRSVLALFTIGFGLWAYYAGIIGLGLNEAGPLVLKLATIVAGAALLSITAGFRPTLVDPAVAREQAALRGLGYSFSALGILGGGIALGGAMDIGYLLLLGLGFYGSVRFQSRALLVLTALFLIAHIVKLTTQYFIGSIGWAVGLIAAGALIIVVGAGTLYLNQRFLRRP